MRKLAMMVMAAALASQSAPSSAAAQSINDDVRCFLLSNGFAQQANDPKAKQLAAASLTFFMGRLDAKADPVTIARIAKVEGPKIDPKTAGPLMSQCAARLGQFEKSVQAALKPANAPK